MVCKYGGTEEREGNFFYIGNRTIHMADNRGTVKSPIGDI